MQNAVAKAPYASTPIPLFLDSITGTRYRSLNCVECGREFLERNNETMHRSNDMSQPDEIAINGETLLATCGDCSQQYSVNISLSVTFEQGGIPLYLQPESIYMEIEANKCLRYLHCMECGKVFQSISDRVSKIVDNRIPFEYLDPSRFGPIQRTCISSNCGQEWALIL